MTMRDDRYLTEGWTASVSPSQFPCGLAVDQQFEVSFFDLHGQTKTPYKIKILGLHAGGAAMRQAEAEARRSFERAFPEETIWPWD